MSSEINAIVRIINSETGTEISRSESFLIQDEADKSEFKKAEDSAKDAVINEEN